MASGSRSADRTRTTSCTAPLRERPSASASVRLAGRVTAPMTRAPARTCARRICSVKPARPVRSQTMRGCATNVPPCRPGRRTMVPTASSPDSAWRSVIRLTPSEAASCSSRGSLSPGTRVPSTMHDVSHCSMRTYAGRLDARARSGAVPSASETTTSARHGEAVPGPPRHRRPGGAGPSSGHSRTSSTAHVMYARSCGGTRRRPAARRRRRPRRSSRRNGGRDRSCRRCRRAAAGPRLVAVLLRVGGWAAQHLAPVDGEAAEVVRLAVGCEKGWLSYGSARQRAWCAVASASIAGSPPAWS